MLLCFEFITHNPHTDIVTNVNDEGNPGYSLGNGNPWSIVIDASPSMAHEIESLQLELKSLVQRIQTDAPLLYSLTTFQNNIANEPLAIYESSTKIFSSTNSYCCNYR